MFKVGDKVVYPMHGAGIIESIEEKEIGGKKISYYVMHVPVGNMRVMVPVEKGRALGLREVVSRQTAAEIMDLLQEEEREPIGNWNLRYRQNMEKIKSGDARAVAEVVRSLGWRDRQRGLSTGERKMLDTARQILLSELALVWEEEKEKITERLEEVFA
ncbi:MULTISPECIES: CarD family transcriptional regulator [Carboxydocella]|uniref:Transcriptional regulator, CarD family n=2 Tax=Carboxydocella TaxID=178898 RepID=A0A1T4S5T6_9FIRM|nr:MULTISPECIES: CarD family transcriptional regulator [Carboxydocella]AVX21839.1 transcriptional regulator, CarD family [Carboxydocella thermautotrophica]AVX32238.1 transcriptional regulator, CarD family [Carboxydocella thermautotrophica]SKA23605.1 transcriptional regulator, CarD family [Carboxydocella sporoproducens DSM 16521]